MNTVRHRRNKQRQRMVIFSFGLLAFLFLASKNPNFPSEWTGIHSSSDCKMNDTLAFSNGTLQARCSSSQQAA